MGVVEFGEEIDVRGRRGFSARNRAKHAQMDNAGSSKLRLVRAQYSDDSIRLHALILPYIRACLNCKKRAFPAPWELRNHRRHKLPWCKRMRSGGWRGKTRYSLGVRELVRGH